MSARKRSEEEPVDLTAEIPGKPHGPSAEEFIVAQATPEFQHLRRTLRIFVFPMTVFFLTWYGLYLILGVFDAEWMGTPVWGNINIGLIMGLLQFVTTFAITGAYIWYTNHRLDPAAEVVREGFENGTYAREAAAAPQGGQQ